MSKKKKAVKVIELVIAWILTAGVVGCFVAMIAFGYDFKLNFHISIPDNFRKDTELSKAWSNKNVNTFKGRLKQTINKDNPNIELLNSIRNTKNFTFTLETESGEVLTIIEDVRPGQHAYVNLYDTYNVPGEYKLIIVITPTGEDGISDNSVKQDFYLTVEY